MHVFPKIQVLKGKGSLLLIIYLVFIIKDARGLNINLVIHEKVKLLVFLSYVFNPLN